MTRLQSFHTFINIWKLKKSLKCTVLFALLCTSGSQTFFKATQTYWKNQVCEFLRSKYVLIWLIMFLGPKNGTAVNNQSWKYLRNMRWWPKKKFFISGRYKLRGLNQTRVSQNLRHCESWAEDQEKRSSLLEPTNLRWFDQMRASQNFVSRGFWGANQQKMVFHQVWLASCITKLFIASFEVETKKKKISTTETYKFPRVRWVVFCFCFLHVSLFADVDKKSEPKEFFNDPTLGRHPYVEKHGSTLHIQALLSSENFTCAHIAISTVSIQTCTWKTSQCVCAYSIDMTRMQSFRTFINIYKTKKVQSIIPALLYTTCISTIVNLRVYQCTYCHFQYMHSNMHMKNFPVCFVQLALAWHECNSSNYSSIFAEGRKRKLCCLHYSTSVVFKVFWFRHTYKGLIWQCHT